MNHLPVGSSRACSYVGILIAGLTSQAALYLVGLRRSILPPLTDDALLEPHPLPPENLSAGGIRDLPWDLPLAKHGLYY